MAVQILLETDKELGRHFWHQVNSTPISIITSGEAMTPS